MSNNTALKAIIDSAKSICLQKIDSAKDHFGKENTNVLNIEKETKAVFDKFDSQGFWNQVIPSEPNDVMLEIMKLSAIDMSDLDNFVSIITTFLTFLETKVLAGPLAALGEASTPIMNTLAISALRNANNKILGRKVVFKENKDDPKLIEIDGKYKICYDQYKAALLKDTPIATQRDIDSINNSAESISNAGIFEIFLILFEGYEAIIKKKIPTTPSA